MTFHLITDSNKPVTVAYLVWRNLQIQSEDVIYQALLHHYSFC